MEPITAAELALIEAEEILDRFLKTTPDREVFSKTELMDLALDIRSALKIELV